MNRLRPILVVSCLSVTLHFPALAQPVGQGSGPLTELSTNVRAGSGPVRGSVGDASIKAGRLGDRSVRASATGNLVSGPVSDLSVGPVTASRPVTGGGSVGVSSVGAVRKDTESPLGEMTSQPLRDLGALQERLRAIRPLPRTAPPQEEVAPVEGATDASATDVATQQEEPADEAGSAEAADESETAAPEPRVETSTAEQADTEPEKAMPPPTAAETPHEPTTP